MQIDSANSFAGAGVSSAATPGTASRDEFLKLMVAQLEYQDPLNPTDGAEFVAQLAQFTSVEQLVSLNSGMESLALTQVASSNASITGLIGKDVLIKGNSVTTSANGQGGDMEMQLFGDATSVTVDVVDESGNTVRSLELGDKKAGLHDVSWDGKTSDGGPAPAGTYRFEVRARDAEDNTVSAETRVSGRVDGISYEGGVGLLQVGGAGVSLGDVLEVRAPNTPRPVSATDTSEGSAGDDETHTDS